MSTDTENLRALVANEIRGQLASFTAVAPQELGHDLTWSELYRRYALTMDTRRWWRGIVSMLKPTLAHFGPKLVIATKRSDWGFYRDHVAAKRRTIIHGGAPSAATLNLEMRRLKAMCNWGVMEELITRNPLQGVKPRPTGHRDTVVSDIGIDDLLRHCKGRRALMMRAMILIAVDSGMRAEEIRALRWEEIDFDRSLINLSWDRTKTRKARSPRLSERAIEAIRLLPVVEGSPYVFARRSTLLPFTSARVHQLWREISANAGLKAAAGDTRVHFHDLRRSAITRMVKIGIPLIVAMRAAGHSSASETWRYTSVSDDQLDDMKRRIDESVARPLADQPAGGVR